MRGKFGFAVVLLAAAAFVAMESESYGGRRRGNCRSCYSGCGPAGCAVPGAPAEASPSDAARATAPQAAPSTSPFAVAPANAADAVASPSDKRPQPAPSVSSGRPNYNYYTRRGRRRWYRR